MPFKNKFAIWGLILGPCFCRNPFLWRAIDFRFLLSRFRYFLWILEFLLLLLLCFSTCRHDNTSQDITTHHPHVTLHYIRLHCIRLHTYKQCKYMITLHDMTWHDNIYIILQYITCHYIPLLTITCHYIPLHTITYRTYYTYHTYHYIPYIPYIPDIALHYIRLFVALHYKTIHSIT